VGPSVMIVGPGRMGLALASALEQAGAVGRLTICGRTPEAPAHPLFTQGRARYVFGLVPLEVDTAALIIAVPDAAVPEIALNMAAHGPALEGCAALHLSGILGTEVLQPLHAQGYAVGSLHPMQRVSHPVSGADQIPGSYVAVTGSSDVWAIARSLMSPLGCRVIKVPEGRKPLVHAATVMASHYLPILLDHSVRFMERSGVSSEDALPALLSLIQSSLRGIEEQGLASAMRGPLTDGDVETIALHLRALDAEDQRLYALLAEELHRLAGPELDERTQVELAALFDRYLGST
jgi:predicted short-subunit dehydrogenase-like oxidoreductase (DUF2520 family)